SRRRHTRSKRDWSSDVCSSDLSVAVAGEVDADAAHTHGFVDPERVRLALAVGRCGDLRVEGARLTELIARGLIVEGRGEAVELRSEERRVGKEGRCRGWRGL